MGAVYPSNTQSMPAKRRFRAVVKAVITTRRLRWLVTRTKRVTIHYVNCMSLDGRHRIIVLTLEGFVCLIRSAMTEFKTFSKLRRRIAYSPNT